MDEHRPFSVGKPIENLRQINNNAQFDPENRSYCEWEVILPPPIDRVCVNLGELTIVAAQRWWETWDLVMLISWL